MYQQFMTMFESVDIDIKEQIENKEIVFRCPVCGTKQRITAIDYTTDECVCGNEWLVKFVAVKV